MAPNRPPTEAEPETTQKTDEELIAAASANPVNTTFQALKPFFLVVIVLVSIFTAIALAPAEQPSSASASAPTATGPTGAFPSPPYVLYSSRVLLPGAAIAPAAITVAASGRISAVARTETAAAARVAAQKAPFVDVTPLVIFPGLVDPHVHINEPGRMKWEGFASATRAAAAGGTTTLLDMPLNSVPSTTSLPSLLAKARALAAPSASPVVDVGLIAGVVPTNIASIPDLFRAGVLAFKSFMVDSQTAYFDHVTVDEMVEAMEVLSATMRKHDASASAFFPPYMLHAELPRVTDDLSTPYAGADTSYPAYLASRPASWELDAVDVIMRYAIDTGCRVHVVHVSAADAADLITQFIASDVRPAAAAYDLLTAETCPHYLLFSAEEIPDGAPLFKCAPPIRSDANRKRLWKLMGNDGLSMISSDHSPVHTMMRNIESGDVRSAWGGISGLQYRLQASWSAAQELNEGNLGADALLARIGEALSSVPARVFGLDGAKGSIAVGIDADFVIWDPEDTVVVEESDCLHRHGLSAYSGMNLTGVIHRTILRGQSVFSKEGSVPEEAGGGGRVLLRASVDAEWNDTFVDARGVLAQKPEDYVESIKKLRSE